MKYSGNEAKEYLKTKDITFLNGANFVRFVRKLTPISRQKQQKSLHSAKTNRDLRASSRAMTMTNSRLGALWAGSTLTPRLRGQSYKSSSAGNRP